MSLLWGTAHAQYRTNGNAVSVGSDCFRLTQAVNWQSGSVWYLNLVDISKPFDLYFDIYLGCNDTWGADGIAFVLQPISTGIGSAGGGLGYQGVSPSIALEIDTWQNTDANDPAYDHMALMANGNVNHNVNLAGPVQARPGYNNIEDCQTHKLRVSWKPDSMIFRAYVDCNLALSYTGDIISNIFNGNPRVYWGFTSATGGYNNEQRFCLDYISFTEEQGDTAVCAGNSIQLSIGSGDSVSWTPTTGLNDPHSFTPIASPQVTTTYIAQVTDYCGGFRFDTVVVEVDQPFSYSLPGDRVLCKGDSFTITPGLSGVDYLWSDSSKGPSFTAYQNGNYWVEMRNTCDTIRDLIWLKPQPRANLVTNDVNCYGGADGWAGATINAPPRFNFFWLDAAGNIKRNANTFLPADTIQGLQAGSYRLVLFEGNGCVDTLPFIIQEPPAFTANLSFQRDLTCGGTATGTLSAMGMGGTPPYQYSVDGVTFQSNGTFLNLYAGTYTVTVRDSKGCDTTFSTTLTEPPPLILGLDNQRDLPCFGDSSGQISVSATGGYAPYLYQLNSQSFGPGSSYSGLQAGNYWLVVQDDSLCRDSLQVTLQEPAQLLASVDSLLQVSCNGDSSGSLSILANGGSPVYGYSLDGINFQPSPVFNHLPAANYLVWVRDDSSCQTQVQVRITEPPVLGVGIQRVRDVACRGDDSGLLIANAQGGTAPYQYALNNGVFGSSNSFDSLLAGNYILNVRDSLGCMYDTTITIAEPAQDLRLSIDSLVNVDCLGNASGELFMSALGGTLPYQYSINGRVFDPSSHFTGLSARVYTVMVQDTQGCRDTLNAILTSPSGLYGAVLDRRDLACFGDSNGLVTLQGFGGTAPYSYGLDSVTFQPSASYNNLIAGYYNSYIKDSNNCLISVAFNIWEPPLLTAQLVDSIDVGCNGAATGLLVIEPMGGTPGYTYSIDGLNFGPDSTFAGLVAGNYSLTVRDDSGCVASANGTLSEPNALMSRIQGQKNVTCFGDSNAWVQISAQGGVSPYEFALDTLSFIRDSLFSGLSQGSYLITVKDDSGCLAPVQVDITQPDSLGLYIDTLKNLSCFQDSSGRINLMTQGGVGPYAFSLNGGAFGPDSIFRNLHAGSYQIVVRDDSACLADIELDITEPPPLDVRLAGQVDILCYGDENGAIMMSVSGGTLPYAFSLNRGAFGPDSLFSMLASGTYQIMAIDDSGCTGQLEVFLDQPDSLSVMATGQDVLCFGDATGSALANIRGGVMPYDIQWNTQPPQSSLQVQNLVAGRYIAQVMDTHGCSARDTVLIDEPPLLELNLVEVIDAYCDWDNGSATVMARGGLPDYLLSWSTTPGQIEFTAVNLVGGEYTVLLEDRNGCQDSLEVIVNNTPPAVPSFYTVPADSPFILFSQNPVQFVNTSTGAVAYQWEFGDGLGSAEENPLHTYNEPGIYEVVLTAFNEYYVCPAIYTLTLEIAPDGQVFLANAFTPNADGFNDIYYVKGEGIIQMEMLIYDRWGRQIALLQSLDQGWDGRLPNGGDAPEGVYTYVIGATFNSGAKLDRAGTITLIR